MNRTSGKASSQFSEGNCDLCYASVSGLGETFVALALVVVWDAAEVVHSGLIDDPVVVGESRQPRARGLMEKGFYV
jgi:hypothetical protein